MITLIDKKKSIEVLSNYLRKIKISEIPYYIDKPKDVSIPQFLESNVYEHEDIELSIFFFEHFEIALKKIFMINYFDKNLISNLKINVSFVSNLLYWDDIFVIENTLFISNSYLIKIFERIEYKDYNKINDLYFNVNKIYDKNFIKKIINSIIYIIQFTNHHDWINNVKNKYNCDFVLKSNIKFKNNYKILLQPNNLFLSDKITIYPDYNNHNIYFGVFESISSSSILFSPYWNTKIIKLKFSNGYYEEFDYKIEFDNNNDFDDTTTNNNLVSNPFENIFNDINYEIFL